MTTYERIKTYVAGQHWDEELGQNVQYKYATDAPKPPQRSLSTEAGAELDWLARQRMTLFPNETYKQAFASVMADHPLLKEAYGGTK